MFTKEGEKGRRGLMSAAVSLLTALMIFAAAPFCGSMTADAASTLQWPVPGHTGLSQSYSSGHQAIDINDGSIAGANVYAAWDGTVTTIYKCGQQHYGSNHDCNGFGTGLAIQGTDGRTYQYAHMQAGSIPGDVYYGATVRKGQKIGKVGSTGNASGPHLHFGISNGSKYWENLVNPMSFSYTYSDPNAHTHSYSSSVTKQPTCTATGVRTYRCSCGASYTESIAKTSHKYSNTVVDPTTSARGYTKHTCTVCGYSYNDSYTDPIKEENGWMVSSVLPSGITSDKYEIQYNNHYEKTQTSSPGSGWTNAGTAKTEWKNSGGQYKSATDLATSDSRVLVSSVYYHFCGPNAGDEGNYEQTGKFVHYDGIDASRVTSKYLGTDNGHPYYFIYLNGQQLYCHSGTTCDGSWGTHGNRCRAWYKENTYQDRVKVTYYKFTKDSGWTTSKDSSATSVKYRYRLKHSHSYSSEVTTEPTCAKAGVRTYTCSCGNSYTESIPKTGNHSWDEGAVTKEPAAYEDGVMTYTCTVCGAKRTEAVPATGEPEETTAPEEVTEPEEVMEPEGGQNGDQDEVTAGDGAADEDEEAARAEEERLAREKAEKERIAREKAEKERLAREKAEKERIAREKAEKARIAREKEMLRRMTPASVSIKKAKGSKGKISVSWRKLSKNAQSYQIEIRNTKNGAASMVYAGQGKKNTLSKTVKVRKGTYVVRVRAVNKAGNKTLYGNWSAAKAVKVR